MVVFGFRAARRGDADVLARRQVTHAERAVDELAVIGADFVGNQREMQRRRELRQHDEPRRAARRERGERAQRGDVAPFTS